MRGRLLKRLLPKQRRRQTSSGVSHTETPILHQAGKTDSLTSNVIIFLAKHRAAAEKASNSVLKLREEANRHKDVVAKQAAAKSKVDEELIKAKHKLAEACKKFEDEVARNNAAKKREQGSKDATNRLWAKDR